MLKSADLSLILDDDQGDLGFNDPVTVEFEKTAKPYPGSAPAAAIPKASGRPAPVPKAPAPASKPAAAAPDGAAPALPKPGERPAVLGAAPVPAEDADPEQQYRMMAADEAARKLGYRDALEYQGYFRQEMAKHEDLEAKAKEEMEQQQPAPGVRKPPAWQVPGAYPGDRTKVGKEFEKALNEGEIENNDYRTAQAARVKHGVEQSYIRQGESSRAQRANYGSVITFRVGEDGPIQEAEVGGKELPWALEVVAQRAKAGDIIDVVGRGEYAQADDETKPASPDFERRWRFELIEAEGKKDKFNMDVDDRIDFANTLRLRGNKEFKRGRLLRALELYEKGSSFMDVLEAEGMGAGAPASPLDKISAERNKRIWSTSKPLLLNMSLILIKLGHYREAERRCTEVLIDIDTLNVKALFRRGQCNVRLGNAEQARSDLRRAAELDTSIEAEVAREMVAVDGMLKAAEDADRGMARKVVQGYLEEGDERSTQPAPRVAPQPNVEETFMSTLNAQREAAERDGIDDDEYIRQREAIYNSMLYRGPPPEDAEDPGPVAPSQSQEPTAGPGQAPCAPSQSEGPAAVPGEAAEEAKSSWFGGIRRRLAGT